MGETEQDGAIEERAGRFRERFQAVREEVRKVIVGHEPIIDGVLTALFVGGNVLLEGVPGLGKTLLVRTLGTALDLEFGRIQFTPDLMPADILGTDIVREDAEGGREFVFRKGPVFCQILLADEINRATPKTQSALLEAMQEQKITYGGTTYPLGPPFFVLATQNPLEQEGTYPLPEAQLDRFLLKLDVEYSSRDELKEILTRTTEGTEAAAEKVMEAEEILEHQELVREIVAADHVKDLACRLVLATHPRSPFSVDETDRFVRWGSSPRGAQALVLAGKVRALRDGRYHVSFDDVREVAAGCLRHRMILNFEGEAEGVSADDIIGAILDGTPDTAQAGEALGAGEAA